MINLSSFFIRVPYFVRFFLFLFLFFYSSLSFSALTIDQAFSSIISQAQQTYGSNWWRNWIVSPHDDSYSIINSTYGYESGLHAYFSTTSSCTYTHAGVVSSILSHVVATSSGSVCAQPCQDSSIPSFSSGNLSQNGYCTTPYVCQGVTLPVGEICNTPPPVSCTLPALLDTVTNTCQTASCSYPTVLNNLTGICDPLPVCSSSQNPASDECVYSSASSFDCADGTTVYSPSTCPNTLINSLLVKPGQSVTCSDGQIATYPATCLDKYVSRQMTNLLSNPYSIGAIALASRFVPAGSFAVAVGKLLSDSSIKADVQIATKIDNASRFFYGTVQTDIPTITLGKAISEYIKSSPSSAYVSQLSQGFSNGASKTNLIIDSNTGSVTIQGSSVPLSSNQLGSVARYLNDVAPIPSSVSTFVDVATIPWLAPALDAIEGDFANVFDPITPGQPLNFPNAVSSSLSSLSSSTASLPKLATLTKDSSLTYTKPVSSVLSKTLASSNSLATPAANSSGVVPTFELSPLPSSSVVINGVSESLPVSPSVTPDTWMYADFMKFSNPFSFDVSKYLPSLPSPVSCSYEVHTTLHIPFIGNKQFNVAPCVPLQPLRDVLNWAFAVMTAFVCFNVIFRSQI